MIQLILEFKNVGKHHTVFPKRLFWDKLYFSYICFIILLYVYKPCFSGMVFDVLELIPMMVDTSPLETGLEISGTYRYQLLRDYVLTKNYLKKNLGLLDSEAPGITLILYSTFIYEPI